jgi:integrase
LEVEQWLRALKKEEDLANPTLDKTRRVMSLVFRHGQRYGLIPRNQESNPMRFVRCKTTSGYEALILTPDQAYAVMANLQEPERTLTLLAAGTGLRISECLGLQWQDVSFAEGLIRVRRTWTCGRVGLPKSKPHEVPFLTTLYCLISCCGGIGRHPILGRATGSSPPSVWTVDSRA